jgi:hypothetical protein
LRLGTCGTGLTQRRALAALRELREATTAELCRYVYGRIADRRVKYIRHRSIRAALHAIGAVVIDRRYDGGFVWVGPKMGVR